MFNTLVSMSVFTTICCIYTYVKTKFGKDIYILDKEGKPELLFGEPQLRYSKTTMLSFITFAFYILVAFSQISASLSIFSAQCPNSTIDAVSQLKVVGLTILPWAVIFGVLTVILNILPGWKSPFSNTFGYIFARILGIRKLMGKLLLHYDENGVADDELKITDDIRKAIRTVRPIFDDPSMLINQVNTDTFDKFWKTMTVGKIFKTDADVKKTYGQSLDDLRKELQGFVLMKDNIAELVWFLLAGVFTVSVVSFNVSRIPCPGSVSQVQADANDAATPDDDGDSDNETQTDPSDVPPPVSV